MTLTTEEEEILKLMAAETKARMILKKTRETNMTNNKSLQTAADNAETALKDRCNQI